MEALQFSTVASRHFSAATSPSLSANKTISISRSLNRICSSWGGPNRSTSLSSKNLFTKEVWSWVNSKTVTSRRDMRGIVRAEMFGQLTSGLEAAWNKLKGEVVKKYGSKLAKKRDLPETSRSSQQKPSFPLRFSKTLVAQSSIALFGLGFIDAGYSGDWSRIGVISKEFEDLLKMAAFAVVPFCFFIIFDISKKLEE